MSDLPPTTAPGQVYGAQADQRRAQEAIPMGPQTPLRPPPSLSGPSTAPNEPVTAGLASGPGAGPESLAMLDQSQLTIATLRKLYRRFPSEHLAQLIDRYGRGA